jgi:hypothetical protein
MNGGGFFASNGESCFCCKDSSDATTDLTEMSGYNIYRLNDVILAESKHCKDDKWISGKDNGSL